MLFGEFFWGKDLLVVLSNFFGRSLFFALRSRERFLVFYFFAVARTAVLRGYSQNPYVGAELARSLFFLDRTHSQNSSADTELFRKRQPAKRVRPWMASFSENAARMAKRPKPLTSQIIKPEAPNQKKAPVKKPRLHKFKISRKTTQLLLMSF